MSKKSVPCICKKCEKVFFVKPYDRNRGRGKYCSRKCYFQSVRGEGNPFYGKTHTIEVRKFISRKQFKRGWSITDGYIRIYERGNTGPLLHRVLIEKLLKRKLEKGEVVHHINEDLN